MKEQKRPLCTNESNLQSAQNTQVLLASVQNTLTSCIRAYFIQSAHILLLHMISLTIFHVKIFHSESFLLSVLTEALQESKDFFFCFVPLEKHMKHIPKK